MQLRIGSSKFVLALCLLAPAVPANALDVSVDCAKKSLAVEVGKLNKLAANTMTISGNCTENIVIDGHLNLTLVGNPGAGITAADSTKYTLAINNSSVTVRTLAINGGSTGAACENRSTCIFRDVTVQGGDNGIGAQGQSAIDIIGDSSIVDTTFNGIGVYGASSVNIRPTWSAGFDPAEPGPVISGHETGIVVQDGSFLRTDSVTISGNVVGVLAHRNATIKVFANQSGATVSNNTDTGILVTNGSVGQLGMLFSNNGVAASAGALSFVTVSGSVCSGNTTNTSSHPTAVLQGLGGAPTCN